MRKLQVIFTMLLLGTSIAGAQHYDRGYDSAPSSPFVKKGSWMAGGTLRYSQHVNDNYSFLVIDGIDSKGYNIAVNPSVLYMFKDNIGVGLRFSYDRSMLDLSSADLSFSEISMSARNCYRIQHRYSAYAVYRAYIQLASAKRLALFADLMLGGSFSQGKDFNAGGSSVVGSYGQNYSVELAVNPGISVFLTDRLSMEMNVGIFGASYRWSDQIHNQASQGNSDSTSAGFMLNLLSIGVGLSYYFL